MKIAGAFEFTLSLNSNAGLLSGFRLGRGLELLGCHRGDHTVDMMDVAPLSQERKEGIAIVFGTEFAPPCLGFSDRNRLALPSPLHQNRRTWTHAMRFPIPNAISPG
jgi:hypothetical protein